MIILNTLCYAGISAVIEDRVIVSLKYLFSSVKISFISVFSGKVFRFY